MKRPAYTLTDIERVLGQPQCNIVRAVLERERVRLTASKGNKGAAVRYDDAAHVKDRERKAAKRREK